MGFARRALLLMTSTALHACADEAARHPSAFQPRHPGRPDQTELSSEAPCYCFPKGPDCHDSPYINVPEYAPTDLPACADGEACYATTMSYTEGFASGPAGRCRRTCFHEGAVLPAYATTPELRPYWFMDCAKGERCARWRDPGFEYSTAASAGMCIPDPNQVSN